jgi:hypothetical protein
MNYIENPEEEIANSAAYGGTSISPEYEILTNKS